ncbi:MAG: ATP-binding protein [Chloroflexi bacterium]|nr:ATP-binding protein [Chloroflexota bacterium]
MQTQTSTSRASTGTWSDASEANESTPGADCPICKGAKFVHPMLPSGKPDFSRVVSCRCARRGTGKERQDSLLRYSNLGALSRFTFDSLLPQGVSGNPASQERFGHAYEAAKAFATEPKGWMILVGPSGCGKTHLAAAIANERIKRGSPAFFITAADLLDHLRAAYKPESEMPYDELFDRVRNAPLLVLDDLGTQSSTPWAKEKLDQLLNHRYNSGLPTVITTSTPVAELEERLRTRLADSRLCRIYVLDVKQDMLDYGSTLDMELLKGMTFEKFDWHRVNLPLEQRENLAAAYRLATEFAGSPDGWLVFMGVTGCGKTHLAAAIANYRKQAGQPVLFVVVPDFLDHLRSTFSPESKVSYDQLFEAVKTAPLLIMDDFGEQSTTPWAKEKLYQVINYRYNARLPTVFTTRYSLEEINAEIESSISSRLVDAKLSTPFNITAPDYRGDVHSAPAQPRTYHRGKRERRE